MNLTVLIPARLASTRLPEKPLADIAGLPMVVRVAQRVAQGLPGVPVVVAADHARIVAACQAHGVRALLTRADHLSGSDRLAEAVTLLGLPDAACVVNVQGDEPLIDPELVRAVAELLQTRPQAAMSTAAHPITTFEEFANPNVVKVVCDAAGWALYFSRACIPWPRDTAQALPQPAPWRHIGLYGYRAGFLRQFPLLSPSHAERTESLEQLRALHHGARIAVHLSPQPSAAGVDTPEDLERVRRAWLG